jgi:hypothetical protein
MHEAVLQGDCRDIGLFVGTQKLLPDKPEPNLPQIGIRRGVAPLAEASLQRT